MNLFSSADIFWGLQNICVGINMCYNITMHVKFASTLCSLQGAVSLFLKSQGSCSGGKK